MIHGSQSGRGEIVPQRRPTSLDLILQARAMRSQWFVSAFARLRARFARRAAALVARPQPGLTQEPAGSASLRFAGRPSA